MTWRFSFCISYKFIISEFNLNKVGSGKSTAAGYTIHGLNILIFSTCLGQYWTWEEQLYNGEYKKCSEAWPGKGVSVRWHFLFLSLPVQIGPWIYFHCHPKPVNQCTWSTIFISLEGEGLLYTNKLYTVVNELWTNYIQFHFPHGIWDHGILTDSSMKSFIPCPSHTVVAQQLIFLRWLYNENKK